MAEHFSEPSFDGPADEPVRPQERQPKKSPTKPLMTRRNFLAGIGGFIGGLVAGDKFFENSGNKKHQRPVDLPRHNEIPTPEPVTEPRGVVEVETKSERRAELEGPFLRDELLADINKSEGGKMTREEHDRIIKTETIIHYAVRFSASPGGIEKSFAKILGNREYREKINNWIVQYCNEFNVPYSVAAGIAGNESSFDDGSLSTKGAKGVFQILTDFSKDADKDYNRPISDPLKKNIFTGIKYLSKLYATYGQWALAAMAFSTGQKSFDDLIQLKTGKRFDAKKQTWPEFLAENNMNALTLYSKEYYRLGTTAPFQYPFYVLAGTEIAENIVTGKVAIGQIGDLVSPEEIRKYSEFYPAIKRRIFNKIVPDKKKGRDPAIRAKAIARVNEMFKRLKI